MLETKISATFLLPGSTLVAEKPISKKGKTEEELKAMKEEFERTHREEHLSFFYNHKRHHISIWVRKGKNATQTLNLTQMAYNFFISEEGRLAEYKQHEWKHLSKNKKVKLHLLDIGKNLQGKLLEFQVFED